MEPNVHVLVYTGYAHTYLKMYVYTTCMYVSEAAVYVGSYICFSSLQASVC